MNIRNIFRPVVAVISLPIGFVGGLSAGAEIREIVMKLPGPTPHPDDITSMVWSLSGAILGMVLLPAFTLFMTKGPKSPLETTSASASVVSTPPLNRS